MSTMIWMFASIPQDDKDPASPRWLSNFSWMYSCDSTCMSCTITVSLCSAHPFQVMFVHRYNSFLGAFCCRASQIRLAVEPQTFSRGTTATKQSREACPSSIASSSTSPWSFPSTLQLLNKPPIPHGHPALHLPRPSGVDGCDQVLMRQHPF